jgi:hypothetical protein
MLQAKRNYEYIRISTIAGYLHSYCIMYTNKNSMTRHVIICTWMDGWMDGWTDGRTDGWMDGRTDGWMDGRMDGWTDGRTDRWIERYLFDAKSIR